MKAQPPTNNANKWCMLFISPTGPFRRSNYDANSLVQAQSGSRLPEEDASSFILKGCE